jgi:hypothetical protein
MGTESGEEVDATPGTQRSGKKHHDIIRNMITA